jgi:hypothetical protein
MARSRKFWFKFAVVAAVANVGFGLYASVVEEPVHAFVHGALAVIFGVWASFMSREKPVAQDPAEVKKVMMLEDNLSDLERQLHETQQRLDFADQLLKQRPKTE